MACLARHGLTRIVISRCTARLSARSRGLHRHPGHILRDCQTLHSRVDAVHGLRIVCNFGNFTILCVAKHVGLRSFFYISSFFFVSFLQSSLLISAIKDHPHISSLTF